MKQIRSDELWGNYSIAGKSAASKRRHGSLRRAKLGVFARESAKGELESKSEKAKTTDVKIQKKCL